MYHAACKVEFQPFNRSYSQLTFFNLFIKTSVRASDVPSASTKIIVPLMMFRFHAREPIAYSSMYRIYSVVLLIWSWIYGAYDRYIYRCKNGSTQKFAVLQADATNYFGHVWYPKHLRKRKLTGLFTVIRLYTVRFSEIENPTVRFGAVLRKRKSYGAVRCGFHKL